MTFIGLNPSTADEESDDPTIRRCLGFARRWGARRLSVVNLSPLVATCPDDLIAAGSEPADVARGNLRHVGSAVRSGQMVVAAWGRHGSQQGRDKRILDFLMASGGVTLHALAVNVDGSPRHPLYLPADVRPEVYRHPRS